MAKKLENNNRRVKKCAAARARANGRREDRGKFRISELIKHGGLTMTFEIIKKNYDRGLWNAKQVEIAKNKGLITEEQYKEIVKSK